MGDILVCPKCHERLWVGEMQIPLVTCPKCLTRVINPNAGREAIALQSGKILPRQVIPLESEVDGDIWGINVLLRTLAAALVGAGILVIKMAGMSGLSVLLIVAGMAIGGLTWVLRRNTPEIEVLPPAYLGWAQRGTPVLDYGDMRDEGSVGGFIGGFILAITFCFLVMMAIFATPPPLNRVLAITAIVVGIGAFVACSIPASRRKRHGGGFYGGVGAGLFVGAMSCGPCSMIAFE